MTRWPSFPADPLGRIYYWKIVIGAAITTVLLSSLVAAFPYLDWPRGAEKVVVYVFVGLNAIPVCAALVFVVLPAVALGAGKQSLAVAWFAGTIILCVPWWDWVARGWARKLTTNKRDA